MSAEPWYVEAFRAEYVRVYPHRDVDAARREIAALRERGLAGRVLDLCCGFGRHTLALREHGYDAYGLDRSAELLAAARDLPGGALLEGRLLLGDARRLPLAAERFDRVLVLFSSFGYFGERGDEAMLAECARVLRSGGEVVLDLMNPERVRAELAPSSRTERGGAVLLERRWLEDDGRRVLKEVELRIPGRAPRRWVEDVRMYAPEELDSVLARAGFAPIERSAGFAGGAFGPRAERQLVRARRG
jgi:SAM-dependent methyltransferase